MSSYFFYDFLVFLIFMFNASTPNEKAIAKYKYPFGIAPTIDAESYNSVVEIFDEDECVFTDTL